MNTLYWLVTITDRPTTDAFLKLYKSFGVDVSLRTVGAGTAVQETLSTLGLEKTEKAVLLAVVTAESWQKIQKDLRRKMQIDVPGTGIAFIVPLSSIGGKRALMFLTEHQPLTWKEESTLKDTRYELLLVIANQGHTGAIMAVPAHDQRDWDFAKAFGIDIIQVIKGGDIEKEAYTGDGEMINSDFLNGTDNKKESIEKMLEFLKERGIGEKGVQYKMKDWAFNRQRYWGEPIPIVHCPDCGIVPVPYEELPLELPPVENFQPGQDGESPLAKIDSFVHCKCPKCGKDARRETDTMPQLSLIHI